MKRVVGLTAATAMLVTALVGCGGGSNSSSSSGSYCGDIKTASTQLGALGANTFADQNFAALELAVHKVAAEAPSDIQASWTLIATEFDALQKAITDAGLSMDDFSKLTQGQTPPSTDPAKLAALEKTLQGMDTSGLSAASDKIEAEVKKDCKVDLSSTAN